MKYFKYLLVVALVAVFSSCEEDIVVYDNPTGYIQFATEDDGTVNELTEDPSVTSVILGTESNPNGVDVNFTVTSSDPSRYTVSPSNGVLTIPAGEFSGDIIITPVDNFDVDGDVEITITLEESSDLPVGIGGENNFFNVRTVNLVDNDCPIDINAFVGTYSVSENFTAGVNSPLGLSDFFGESYQVELALVPNDITGTKVVITNSTGFDTYFDDGVVMSFLTCNGEVSFDAGFPRVALFRTFAYTASSYSEDDLVITATGPLATFGAYQFTLTKL